MTALRARGLRKQFGARVAVDGIDLDATAGQILGLLGPNGAGKTTTISMIAGVLDADAGEIELAGHDLRRAPMAARAALGLVPQELALYDELSARANLEYVGQLYGVRGALLAERVAWGLGVAGLAERASEPVKGFSGGMKRRLNLAAGILHRPAVLILDEPTVGVDPQSRSHLLAAVRELARGGMAVVYTSHYMEEVQAMADRIAIMDGGRVIAAGTLDELLASHARGQLRVELADEPHAHAVAAAMLDHGATVSGRAVTLTPVGALAPVVAAIEAAIAATPGARLVELSTRTGDLEAVFLGLTGQRLRDEAA